MYPSGQERIMARVREMRGGKDYDAKFGTRMTGTGIWAQMIRQRFEKGQREAGLQPDALRPRPHAVPQAFDPAGTGIPLLAVPCNTAVRFGGPLCCIFFVRQTQRQSLWSASKKHHRSCGNA
jgi:hypothetical protein